MGLDMYAWTTQETPAQAVDFTPGAQTELHYWRKHPNLHGWMERLYRAKGGTAVFNCTTVELTAADLDQLEADVRAGSLPHTVGFFFGASTGDSDERADDLEFIDKARSALAQGRVVFYDSWW